MTSLSSSLYTAASFLCFAIIPKHVKVGLTLIPKAIEAIPATEEFTLAKAIIPATWHFVNGYLVTLGLLNYRWARSGGPTSTAEQWMVGANALAGALVGVRYYKAGLNIGLLVLWLAPSLSIAAGLL
ncbi:uncharacterized protein BO97DRAFT_459886 [Aspergillus homomorphus CBS 101889]|uniref:Integral membrane protein n=1 Tax=Aspergillus homomorphus (strain CBS 101889) TaxID=1450537 RepID=A0A395HLT2_ASPHC|nr:hypothetical protein BO97DRAFT_459886 [Aspergillus homomorphus CBS 101889]RAL08902.1 hypothetical protein BO97DRAFT_459886 [Aspergillus homomorphus CBS 101889]